MDAGNELGPEGVASLAPALEKMPQLTSLILGGARIRFWARPLGLGWVGSFGACCWVRAWMRCGVDGVLACGRGMGPTDCKVCAEGGRRWMQELESGLRGQQLRSAHPQRLRSVQRHLRLRQALANSRARVSPGRLLLLSRRSAPPHLRSARLRHLCSARLRHRPSARLVSHQCGEQNAALKSRAFGPRTAAEARRAEAVVANLVVNLAPKSMPFNI